MRSQFDRGWRLQQAFRDCVKLNTLHRQ